MSHLVIDALTHRYPGSDGPALDAVSLEVASGEVLALIGASGSGKSTLLRTVAGLERPALGTISLGGEVLTSGDRLVPPERRHIGMVSQSGDLFPHLTVLRNTAYGLRQLPRSERRGRALEALDRVGLATHADRFPAELSGGEAQRVALARALAVQPSILLLDEPFSNLDASLRERLRSETLDLLRRDQTTAVFVTHHGDDALAAGDRIAVMRAGRVGQSGTPQEVWDAPSDAAVAALFGSVNLLPGAGDTSPLWFRPDQLELCPPDTAGRLAHGTVERVDYLGSHQHAVLRVAGCDQPVRVEIAAGQTIEPGSEFGVARLDR